MKTLENIQDLKKLLLNSYTLYTYDYAVDSLLMTLPTTSRFTKSR